MIGLLLFLATLPIVPHSMFAVVALYALCFRWRDVSQTFMANAGFVVGVLVFILGCLGNFLAHSGTQTVVETPYFLAIFFTMMIAYGIRQRDLKFFLYLLCFEVGVGLYELLNGVSSIFPLEYATEVDLDEDMLYNRKVFGLSIGSNTFACKLLLGLIFVDLLYKDWGGKSIFFRAILIIGLIISFNRTTIISYFVYRILYFCIWPDRLPFQKQYRVVLLSFLAVCVGGIVVYYWPEISTAIFEQFTRGRGEVDLSGRPAIWSQALSFIDANWLLGNGSYRADFHILGRTYHAHNSYLQIVANNGVLLGGFFMIWLCQKFNRNNFGYIVALLIYSIAQYGIFWGISLPDIVLFVLLCKPSIYQEKKHLASVVEV